MHSLLLAGRLIRASSTAWRLRYSVRSKSEALSLSYPPVSFGLIRFSSGFFPSRSMITRAISSYIYRLEAASRPIAFCTFDGFAKIKRRVLFFSFP